MLMWVGVEKIIILNYLGKLIIINELANLQQLFYYYYNLGFKLGEISLVGDDNRKLLKLF